MGLKAKKWSFLKATLGKGAGAAIWHILEGELLNFGNRTATKNVPLAWPPETSPTCAACRKRPGPSSDVATEKTGRAGPSQRAESGPSQGGGPHGTCHGTCCLLPALLQPRASPALSLSLSHHLILVQSGQ